MNIKDLRYLIAIAEHQHFGRAALTCEVSQPTLSMQLKKLEEFLGAPLIDRTSAQASLTDTGKIIVEQARDIVNRIDSLVENAHNNYANSAQTLRVGLRHNIPLRYISQHLDYILQKHPNLKIISNNYTTADLISNLRNGDLDCIIGFDLEKSSPNLDSYYINTQTYKLLVNKQHPLAQAAYIDFKDLNLASVIAFAIDEHIIPDANANIIASSLESMLLMVRTNAGVAVLPECIDLPNKFRDFVQFKEFKPDFNKKIYLYWRPSVYKSGLIKEFAKVLGSNEK